MKVKLVTTAFVFSFFIGVNWVLQKFHTMAHGTEPITTVESAEGVAALTSTRLLQCYAKHACSSNHFFKIQSSKVTVQNTGKKKEKLDCNMLENFCPEKVSKKLKG